jgi:hypothetical protein
MVDIGVDTTSAPTTAAPTPEPTPEPTDKSEDECGPAFVNDNCARLRNGLTNNAESFCVGPKEAFGAPCYPLNQDGGCNGDWKKKSCKETEESSCAKEKCAQLRNGLTADEGSFCVGPKEAFGAPCYPLNQDGGCDDDWTKESCDEKEKKMKMKGYVVAENGDVLSETRCNSKNARESGWGALGKYTDQESCKQKCLESSTCKFAVWKKVSENRGHCTSFSSCKPFVDAGKQWLVWKKKGA